jgi:hypothetical protein
MKGACVSDARTQRTQGDGKRHDSSRRFVSTGRDAYARRAVWERIQGCLRKRRRSVCDDAKRMIRRRDVKDVGFALYESHGRIKSASVKAICIQQRSFRVKLKLRCARKIISLTTARRRVRNDEVRCCHNTTYWVKADIRLICLNDEPHSQSFATAFELPSSV